MANQIIVPITPSDVSREMVRMANDWGNLTDTELNFIHVRSKNFMQGKRMLFTQDETLKKRDIQQMEKFIKSQNVTANYSLASVSGETHLKIIEQEAKLNPDFILIPAHAHTAFKRVFLGSNTRYILNNSKGSVYIYRKPEKKLNNIMIVPLDYSETNTALVKSAKILAQRTDAELVFIHVSDSFSPDTTKPDDIWDWDQHLEEDKQKIEQQKEMREGQREKLGNYVADFNIESKYKTVVEFGRAYQHIMELQKMTDANLIMVAANSSYAEKKNAVGRTAKYLIYDSTCSVYLHKLG